MFSSHGSLLTSQSKPTFHISSTSDPKPCATRPERGLPSSSAPSRHHVGPPCLGVPSQSSRAELHQRRESSQEVLTTACRLPPHLHPSHGSPNARLGVVLRVSSPPGLLIARLVHLYPAPYNAMLGKDGLGGPVPGSPGQHTEQGRISAPPSHPHRRSYRNHTGHHIRATSGGGTFISTGGHKQSA